MAVCRNKLCFRQLLLFLLLFSCALKTNAIKLGLFSGDVNKQKGTVTFRKYNHHAPVFINVNPRSPVLRNPQSSLSSLLAPPSIFSPRIPGLPPKLPNFSRLRRLSPLLPHLPLIPKLPLVPGLPRLPMFPMLPIIPSTLVPPILPPVLPTSLLPPPLIPPPLIPHPLIPPPILPSPILPSSVLPSPILPSPLLPRLPRRSIPWAGLGRLSSPAPFIPKMKDKCTLKDFLTSKINAYEDKKRQETLDKLNELKKNGFLSTLDYFRLKSKT